jgi:hypothetical protein
MATTARPSPGSASFDQMTIYRDTLYVEVMVKSMASEEEVNRRIQRTAEAANMVLMRHQTLRNVVGGFDDDPTMIIGDVFTRKERSSYGDRFFWQGARLEYPVRKEASNPPSGVSIFRPAEPRSEMAMIDQA